VKYLFFICFLLSSCSSRFKVEESVLAKVSCVELNAEIDSEPLYEFKRRFENLIGSNSCNAKIYQLDVKFENYTNNRIVLKKAESIRENIELIVNFELKKDSEIIYKNKFREISSFNTMFSPYSTDIEKSSNEKNLHISAAEELRRRLILFFKRNSKNLENKNDDKI
jgi:hypothetical protein